jgi:hypothetical protein
MPLGDLTTQPAQGLELRVRLDSFRHGVVPEGLGNRDDRMHQRFGPFVLVERDHERLIDLDDVDGEGAQVGERRISGAEIVDGEPDAELLQLVELLTDQG